MGMRLQVPHKGLMKPLENCPYCHVPVTWILHDGLNSYDCTNKPCPIKFTERVWFPKEINNPELKEGILHHYSFDVGKHHIVVDYYDYFKAKLIINPSYPMGLPIKTKKSVMMDLPTLDWSNLSKLEEKIKTWITFS